MKKLNSKKKKGFTLIELIIVVAILGILAAIAIPKFGDAQKDAKISADIANAKTIADTTTLLITKETIRTGTASEVTASPITVCSGDGTTPINIVAPTGNGSPKAATTVGETIASKLQSIPAPKAVNVTNFSVTIDSSGNVKVFAGSVADAAQVYPAITDSASTNPWY